MSENDNECNYLDAMVGLHLGDCFEIIPLIPDKSIDMILTDPPYEFITAYPTVGWDEHACGEFSRGR